MQEWTSLQLELLKYGFHRVEYWQFSCPPHGVFRVAVETSQTSYTCPKCRQEYEGKFVVEGLTRRQPPLTELIDRPDPVAFL